MKGNLLGKTIKQARMDKHLTQEKLAEMTEITPIHLKLIESGKRKPSVSVLFELAKILDFSVDSIIKGINTANDTADILNTDILYLLQKCTPAELRLIADRKTENDKRTSHIRVKSSFFYTSFIISFLSLPIIFFSRRDM